MKKLANRKSIQCFSHIKFGEKRKAKKMCLDWCGFKKLGKYVNTF